MLTQAPVTKWIYNHNSNNKEIDEFIASHGSYYNFNRLANLPEHYFFDDNHLNQAGVNYFNGLLIEKLKQDGKLP